MTDTEHAWRIPVRTELVLCGPWQGVNITVRAAEYVPELQPEPEPVDDLGLCCEGKMTVKQSFLTIDFYTEAVKMKAGFLLDKVVQYSKGKSVNLYAVRQLAKDMKQYADKAWRIADRLSKE